MNWFEWINDLSFSFQRGDRPEIVTGPLGIHSVDYEFDEDGDEYARVGFITGNKRVFAEIDDGTYGTLNALRFYTGQKDDSDA